MTSQMLGVQHYFMASWHMMTTWRMPQHHVSKYETRIFNFGATHAMHLIELLQMLQACKEDFISGRPLQAE